ncbi:hypothetical protein NQZ68_023153 [Dissostichus eleginoides]|nr:hypothetical protein NQZ68_023153 [Dissostichus eleginoides]
MLEPNHGAAVSNLLNWNIAEHLTSKQRDYCAIFFGSHLRTEWCSNMPNSVMRYKKKLGELLARRTHSRKERHDQRGEADKLQRESRTGNYPMSTQRLQRLPSKPDLKPSFTQPHVAVIPPLRFQSCSSSTAPPGFKRRQKDWFIPQDEVVSAALFHCKLMCRTSPLYLNEVTMPLETGLKDTSVVSNSIGDSLTELDMNMVKKIMTQGEY